MNKPHSYWRKASVLCVISAIVVFSDDISFAEEAAPELSATELAKKSQNPVEDMISVVFQNNTYFNTGHKDKTQNVLLFEPVIPFHLTDEWLYIARPIIPFISQPGLGDGQSRMEGLGNIQYESFFSPRKPVNGWILGFGPDLEFPTNSDPDNRFGSDNWSVGPAAVALKMQGPWVFGGLLTQLWSYYGDDPEVNVTSFQPFVNYNLADGWYLSSAPILYSDWSASSDEQWTVPIGGGIGKVFTLWGQPINSSLRLYYNADSPEYTGSDWQLQLSVNLLFPE